MNKYMLFRIVNDTVNISPSNGNIEFMPIGVQLTSGTVYGLYWALEKLRNKYNILSFYDEGKIKFH